MHLEFSKNIKDIERRLTGFKGRGVHQLPDMVFFNMLVDVLENARAAEILVDSEVPRPAYVCTRAALEAAQDVLLMASDPNLYDENGAYARAFEVVELEGLYKRRYKADKALGLSSIPRGPDGQSTINQDAQEWDKLSPGKAQLLLDAYSEVKADKRRHWANLSRKKIAEEIGRRAGGYGGISETNDALYGLLSIHSHPRPRTGMREYTQTANDRYAVASRAFDREGPLGLAIVALVMAAAADDMRLMVP